MLTEWVYKYVLYPFNRKPAMSETVAVLGASPKRERYSNQAIRLLRDYGHTVLPVNPAQQEIEGLRVIEAEKPLQNMHHEFHRGVIVVEHQHLVLARLLGLGAGLGGHPDLTGTAAFLAAILVFRPHGCG